MTGVEPYEVVQQVEQYVDNVLRNAEKYENSTPFDREGVFLLHRLASSIYQQGFTDGSSAADERARRALSREREAKE